MGALATVEATLILVVVRLAVADGLAVVIIGVLVRMCGVVSAGHNATRWWASRFGG